ncbi:hypothetical protein B0A49_06138 [Cryomyces minteri]|uniref:Sodium/calcium exchanger membrane region domain-containing protein n=1 Tax=Cryomyces minteri TaxID=331657 RepID=A0A4U0X7D7_9PEZI|nr:hypothetical protein B0A49_06138 [Cryomyces minteri]
MHRKQKYSARAFFLTILVVVAIAACTLVAERHGFRTGSGSHRWLQRRAIGALHEEFECRLVHQAKDKCAYVLANCPDEEAGLVSYLDFYYCRLPHAKPVAFTMLVVWLGLLFSTIGIAASDFFCVNLSTIANMLGMSESMAGVTLLAFGNGSPDVFSTFAAMSTHSGSLAVGELIGAAGFISAVVAGSMALVRPFKVARKSFVRDIGFFIVAASFSMVFLYDGSLYMWECVTMVAFYIFYVATVIIWHWWLGRGRRRREKEAAARGQYIIPGVDGSEDQEEYHDDDDGDAGVTRPNRSRNVSAENFSLLEQGGTPRVEVPDEDEDEEARDRWMGELSSNMRLSRRGVGERRKSITPIRPSLVGALEFRAVLTSLNRSRSLQTTPINLRRYSDDPNFTTTQQQDQSLTPSDPAARLPYEVQVDSPNGSATVSRPSLNHEDGKGNRMRTVSANDAASLRLDPGVGVVRKDADPNVNLLGASLAQSSLRPPSSVGSGTSDGSSSPRGPSSPSFSISPPVSDPHYRAPSSTRPRALTPDLLAPPESDFPGVQNYSQYTLNRQGFITPSPQQSPRSRPLEFPKIVIPQSPKQPRGSAPNSPFPAYFDYPPTAHELRPPSLRLPPASVSPDSPYQQGEYDAGEEEEEEGKPFKWWPYRVLPPPRILVSTLFPTLYSWHDKNIWEKFLGVVAAPSVFLLTITLPVVESGNDDDNDSEQTAAQNPSYAELRTPNEDGRASRKSTIAGLKSGSPPLQEPSHDHGLGSSFATKGLGGHSSTAHVAATTKQHHQEIYHPSSLVASPSEQPVVPPSDQPSGLTDSADLPTSAKEWNRWLVIIQIFTAPFFTVLILWANFGPDPSSSTTTTTTHSLLHPALYALLFSLVTLALTLLTTTPTHPPRWRPALCFLGFAVSIAWISSIAGEVVGVLKTLGVVLDISDAILGLTVFAVGSSLGDLVADVTVARLGHPVMALSACFGGPMLNILLGIGLGGLWMTVGAAEHRHERTGKPVHFRPYEVQVSGTLMISAAVLLVTLVGLLVVVPLNGWRMDRRIGWGLIALWCVSTLGNVIVEITGWGGFGASSG